MELTQQERLLLAAIEDGLPLDPHPYARIAAQIGATETAVIEAIETLRARGVISRFGVVVRHHELGYRANAMTVWDVPDAVVAATGRLIADMDGVTLCYRRPRRLPDWPYNLFAMVHGRDRDAVRALVDQISERAGLADVPRAVLFSCRRFKQRGARYAAATDCVAREDATASAQAEGNSAFQARNEFVEMVACASVPSPLVGEGQDGGSPSCGQARDSSHGLSAVDPPPFDRLTAVKASPTRGEEDLDRVRLNTVRRREQS